MCFSRCIRSTGHVHKRHTSHLKVPFYVGDRFNEEFSGNNLKNVERSVEEDYISNLRNNCWKEKQQSEFTEHKSCWFMCTELLAENSRLVFPEEGLLYRARYFGDSDLYKKAQKMGTPSCSRLSEIQNILDG